MQRNLLLCLGVLLLVLAVFIPATSVFQQRVFPFFDPTYRLFADVRVTSGLVEHQDALVWSMRQVMPLTEADAQTIISQVLAAEPSRVGVFVSQDGQTSAFYARNPIHDISFDAGFSWHVQESLVGRDQYVLITQQASAVKKPSLFFSGLWSKWSLYRLASEDRGVLYARLSDEVPPVYGLLEDAKALWRIRFSFSATGLFTGFTSLSLTPEPLVVSGLQTVPALELVPLQEPLSALLSGPLRPLVLGGGTFILHAGTLAQVSENPFEDAVVWESQVPVDEGAANAALGAILDALTVHFPMAFERVLPDESVVFELKKGREQFLVPGATADVSIDSHGIFTFPHDQVSYAFAENELHVRKGPLSSPLPGVYPEVPCQIDAENRQIRFTNSFVGAEMWTSLIFSLNQQTGAVCIIW